MIEPMALQRLQQAFATQGEWCAGESPLYQWLCEDLGAGLGRPGDPVAGLFGQYFRTTGTAAPSPALVLLFLGGLHRLVLSGRAPALAASFPSAGGAYGADNRPAVAAAAAAAVREHADDLLEFMLGTRLQTNEPARSTGLLLGALAAAHRFPGGLFLLELGASAGLNLLWDHYAYRFRGPGGDLAWGPSRHLPAGLPPLTLAAELQSDPAPVAGLLALDPPIAGRIGVDLEPRDVTRDDDVALLESFLWPDQVERQGRLRAAVAVARSHAAHTGGLRLVAGDIAGLLPGLLEQAYAATPAGHTLLVYHSVALVYLPRTERDRVAQAIQSFSARLAPGKPLAWLQYEMPGRDWEWPQLRLTTFSDRDPEDRQERLLADMHFHGRWVRWHDRDVSARW